MINNEKSGKILTIKFALLQGSYWMSFCAIYNFATVFLLSKSFSSKEVGVMLAAINIFAAVLQPLVANFADQTNRISLKNLVALIVLVILSITIFLPAASNLMLATGILFFLICTLMVTIQPLINSLGMEYMGKGIHVDFGMARSMGSLSYAVTSFVLGNLIEKNGTGILPYSYIFIFVLILIFTLTFKLTKVNEVTIPHHSKTLASYAESIEVAEMITDSSSSGFVAYFKKYKRFGFYLIGLVFLFTCFNLINIYMIKIIENVGGNKADLGTAIALAAILELPVMFFFSKLLKKFNNTTLLKISVVVLTIKAIATLFAKRIGMIYLAQGFQLLSYAIFIPASIHYVSQVMDTKDRIKGQAFTSVTMTLGGVTGSLLGGWLLGATSIYNMLFLGTILSLIGSIIAYFSIENIGIKSRQ
ncbi:MAG: MFS transporter [Clostridiaceae bacterium]